MAARADLYAVNQNMNNFFTQLMNDFGTEFGNSQAIFNDVSGALTSIVKAGPQQYGFSAAEDAALRTMATESAALSTQRASAFAAERGSSLAGGNTFVPSSVQGQIQGQIATENLEKLGEEQLGITEAGYKVGREQFDFATKALEELPAATRADVGLAGEAITAGKTSFEESSTLKAQEGGLGKMLGGLAGGLLGSIAGPVGADIGAKLGSAIGGAAEGDSTPGITYSGSYGPPAPSPDDGTGLGPLGE